MDFDNWQSKILRDILNSAYNTNINDFTKCCQDKRDNVQNKDPKVWTVVAETEKGEVVYRISALSRTQACDNARKRLMADYDQFYVKSAQRLYD